MITIEDYFTRIFVINREARKDRWDECCALFSKYNLTKVERFQAYDHGNIDGWVGGNSGCVSSHRALLDIIAYHKWPRTLILEDDFHIIHENFHELFNQMIPEVPDDWDMLYLGGHYGEKPQYRVSPHVIRINRMLTTSSYGITWQQARKMAPNIYGGGPIDSLYGQWNVDDKCFILQPRLMIQRDSFSDLQGRNMSNRDCMTNPDHENMV